MNMHNESGIHTNGVTPISGHRETLTAARPTSSPVRRQINRLIASFMRSRFRVIIEGFKDGHLKVIWPDGNVTMLGEAQDMPLDTARPEAPVTVEMFDFEPVRRMAMDGSIGWAEAYIEGHWDTNDLFGLFMLFLENEHNFPSQVDGSLLTQLGNSLRHRWNRNTLRGSKKNISRHYDLGNDFYSLWLDESMSYSSALYVEQTNIGAFSASTGYQSFEPIENALESSIPLAQAQQDKIMRVLDILDPKPRASVLEIGCGWGAVGHALSTRRDCDVIGISLSNEQLDYAREHYLLSEPQPRQLEYRYCDYREMSGQFDHIVSIEMFEAVGREYWDNYFEKLALLLKSGGTAVLQIITILEDRFDDYARQPDFIQKYIFPGGMLPTKAQLTTLADQHGFEITSQEFFGLSYARTLREWRLNFEQCLNDVRAQGFDDRFIRLWRYYLAYCEAGFTIGSTDVGLWTLTRR